MPFDQEQTCGFLLDREPDEKLLREMHEMEHMVRHPAVVAFVVDVGTEES